MAWTQKASLKGDPGPAPQVRVDSGWIQWRTGTGSWNNLIALADLKGDPGDPGAPGNDGNDGTSVTIRGSVADAAALPDDLGPEDAGDGYITADTGHLHVWSGTEFVDAGEIRGPKGDPGDPGTPGAPGEAGPRGTRWYTGVGAPGSLPDSLTGDLYLDTATGTVYELE